MPAARRAAIAAPILAALLACTSFPALQQGQCGNAVVDPNEDCDTFAAQGFACQPAGASGECHFTCAEGTRACPPGYGCSTAGFCRVGNGQFVARANIPISEAQLLQSGDFDGDLRRDLVVETVNDVHVVFGDDGLAMTQSVRIAASKARVQTGKLFPDSTADLVLTTVGGVDTWRGKSDRSLSATLYPSFSVPGASFLIPDDALPQVPGTELFVISALAGTYTLSRVYQRTAAPIKLFDVPSGVDQIARDAQIGNVLEDQATSPCDEIVLTYQNEPRVHVYTPCRAGAAGIITNDMGPGQVSLPDVTLADASLHPITTRLAYVDKDAHLDMIVLASASGMAGKEASPSSFVAYGVGDGTFDAKTPPPASGGNGIAGPFPIQIESQSDTGVTFAAIDDLLAAGDLNGDGVSDLVVPRGIAFASNTPGLYKIIASPADAWTVAQIGDMNANGLLDVIGASATGVDFYSGTGTVLLNSISYASAGKVDEIALGDVDGDGARDAILRTPAVDATGTPIAGQNDISVMFARAAGGFPQAPASIGSLPTIEQLAVAPYEQALVNQSVAADGIADIAVVSSPTPNAPLDSPRTISAIAGRGDRQLTSPFLFVEADPRTMLPMLSEIESPFPQRFALGHFVSSDHEDIACVAEDPPKSGSQLTGDARLWLATLTSTAGVNTATVAAPVDTLPPMFDYGQVKIAAVDLDQAGSDPSAARDELVYVVPPMLAAGTGPGTLGVARVDRGLLVTDATKNLAIGAGPADPTDTVARSWNLKAGDVDGDGARDLVLLYHQSAGMRLTVFWNKQTGSIDPSVSADVPLAADFVAQTFAFVHAGPGSALALVVTGRSGAVLTAWDAQKGAFSSPVPLPNAAGGGGTTTGDFDGDGVEDIAIATNGVVTIYQGQPLR